MTEQDTITTRFEARLGRLERNYRRMTMLATMFASLSVIAVLTGQSPAGPTIVGDPSGARTAITPSGVIVYDARGNVRLDMTIDGTTPGFGVHGPDGKYVFEANGGSVGGFLRVTDNTNNERAFMGIYSNGTSGMQIFNANAKVVVEANSTTTGGYFRAGDGTLSRAFLGVFSSNRAGMEITNAGGKTVVTANEGTPGGFLRLADTAGTDRAYLGLFTDATSGGWVKNASGAQTWHGP